MATVTKDTIIGDILDMDRTTAPYFLEMGMHCLGSEMCIRDRACTAWAARRPAANPSSRPA